MTTKPKYRMIPYQKEDRDIFDGLEFNPDEPPERPDAMYQELPLNEIAYLLHYYLAGSTGRRDVFISSQSFICYDRRNLNVRVGPDCYVALGVDAAAIRDRRLYLPWEAGKAPDFALEMASPATAENDVGDKREIYERIGIGEYWCFDGTGGDHYGESLVGERLVDGRYQRFELTHEAGGSIRGYSPALDLYLSWERQEENGDGWLNLYDPATGERLESYSEVKARAEAAEESVASAQERVAAAKERIALAEERIAAARERAASAEGRISSAESRAEAAEAEAERLREELRRLRGE